MSLTESRIIKQITVLPQSGAINVQWANQVIKDGNVLSETFERCAYSADNLDAFKDGTIDVNAFLAAFNSASLDAKVAAEQAKSAAEYALAAKTTEADKLQADLTAAKADADAKAQALAAKEAELAQAKADLAAAQAQIPAPVAESTNTVMDELQSRLAKVEAAIAAKA